MIKYYNYLNVLFIILVFTACTNNSLKNKNISPQDWINYDCADFALYYPKDWQIDSSRNLETELILHSFMNERDNFRENITIEKYKQEDTVSNDKFLQKIENRLEEVNGMWSQEIAKNIKARNNVHCFYVSLPQEDLSIIMYVFFNKYDVYIVNFTQQAHSKELESIAIQIMETFYLK